MNDTEFIKEMLRKIKSDARSVSGAFDNFISKEITITAGTREVASKSQKSLREFIKNENDRDKTFPVLLSEVDSDYIGGSYGRETKIWPLDDIDIYLPLEGKGLVYFDQSGVLPYIVLSDNTNYSNPINTPRWYRNGVISSEVIINEYAAVLRRHYPEPTEVYPNGQAISIRMTHGETKDTDGLGYDIVPCFSLESSEYGNGEKFYLIPDGSNGWIRTNPRLDADICDYLNKYHNGVYKKVVRLVKFWNKTKLNGVLSSYYIEHAMCGIFSEKAKERIVLSKVSQGVAWGMYELNRVLRIGNQKSMINGAPEITSGLKGISALILAEVECEEVANCAKSAWNLESALNEVAAIKEWKKVFGDSFGE